MANGQLASVFRHLRHLLGKPLATEQTDGQLLHRFVHEHEQTAFTMLVQRHGPMVLGLCRRTLQDEHAAEDVFQAAFLVLVRKASSLHQYGSLGNWLYTVTYHLALKTRARQARQRLQERQVECMPEPVAGDAGDWSELRPLLDAELASLPAKYREPVVLCYLEGKTNEVAARELGWPVGTVKVRLSRARDLLRDRLTRRGLALSTALLGPSLATSASAAVPIGLLETTTEAAALFAAGELAAAGAISSQAVILAQGALKVMFLNRLQFVGVILLVLGLVGAGTGMVLNHAAAEPPPSPDAIEAVAPTTVAESAADAPKKPDPASKPDPAVRLAPPRSRKVHLALAYMSPTFKSEKIEPGSTLQNALDYIAKEYKVTILIDKQAFNAIGIAKVEDYKVELPKMTDVRLTTVLNKLLRQIRGDVYTGTFQVRPDYIEVTTNYHQMAETPAEAAEHHGLRSAVTPTLPPELWGDYTRKISPVVHLDADERPLADVLRDLSTDVELDIVIDRRAAQRAQTPVTLTLNNALLDTAVGLLLEQADLDWMWVDNVVYVATREDIKARKDRKRAAEQEKLKMLRETRAMFGPGAAPGAVPDDSVMPTPPAKPFVPAQAPPPPPPQ